MILYLQHVHFGVQIQREILPMIDWIHTHKEAHYFLKHMATALAYKWGKSFSTHATMSEQDVLMLKPV